MNRADVLNVVLPHRIEAITVLQIVTRLRMKWGAPRAMQVYFDGKLQITGNSSAFMNPVIEAGIIHCRALLDFVGLALSTCNPTKLGQRAGPRRADDWGIECFSNAKGPLPLVSPGQAIAMYKGDCSEAEGALVAVLRIANKALAHITAVPGIPPSPRTLRLAHEARFELHWADLSQRRVPAPGIVEPFDVVKDVSTRIVAGRVDVAMNALLLQ